MLNEYRIEAYLEKEFESSMQPLYVFFINAQLFER